MNIIVPTKLLDRIRDEEGVVSLSYEDSDSYEDRWTASAYFGKNEPEEDIDHASGTGATAPDAFGAMLRDAGVW